MWVKSWIFFLPEKFEKVFPPDFRCRKIKYKRYLPTVLKFYLKWLQHGRFVCLQEKCRISYRKFWTLLLYFRLLPNNIRLSSYTLFPCSFYYFPYNWYTDIIWKCVLSNRFRFCKLCFWSLQQRHLYSRAE